jgi:glycosyltransferase involved in cell wall biosynthesis
VRICLIYDCLFPHTVGGAERWYRNLSERLAAEGHEVSYLTLRQWDRGVDPGVDGVEVRAVGPRMNLYSAPGRRRILPPLVFGAGVLWHLLRHGRRYDVVHTASFPYFSLLAAAIARPPGRYRLVVDWHEVWTRDYWQEYLGRLPGLAGWVVQLVCVRIPQRAFCFSDLHAARLHDEGIHGVVTHLPGEYAGSLESKPSLEPKQLIVFAGRHIPEKRVLAILPALVEARRRLPRLRATILGDGPERPAVLRLVRELDLEDAVDVPGFVSPDAVEAELAGALCLLLPSRREGYGMVVIEAAVHGTPSIVVAGPDNAAVELVSEAENGFIASSAAAKDLADAVVRIQEAGSSIRLSTAAWFERNARRLSMAQSLELVLRAYELDSTAAT